MAAYRQIYQHKVHDAVEERPIHIVVGPSDLLRPNNVSAQTIASLIGEKVRRVPLNWLKEGEGTFTHDILLSGGDNRISAFARSLSEDFSVAEEPLAIFTSLVGAGTTGHESRDGLKVIGEAIQKSKANQVHVYSIGIESYAEKNGIDEIASDMLRHLSLEVTSHFIYCTRQDEAHSTLLRNLIVTKIASSLIDRWSIEGLPADFSRLSKAVGHIVDGWEENGLDLEAISDSEQLQFLAARIDRSYFGGDL